MIRLEETYKYGVFPNIAKIVMYSERYYEFAQQAFNGRLKATSKYITLVVL